MLYGPDHGSTGSLASTDSPLDSGGEGVDLVDEPSWDGDGSVDIAADDSEWAAKELATLRTKSPQTCKVALRQLADSLTCSAVVPQFGCFEMMTEDGRKAGLCVD